MRVSFQAAVLRTSFTLARQFPLRSLLCHWDLGPAQQDTLEFITPLVLVAGLDAGGWEARLLTEHSERKQAEHSGPTTLCCRRWAAASPYRRPCLIGIGRSFHTRYAVPRIFYSLA